MPDLLALSRRDAEHRGDDFDREQRREVGHDVEIVSALQRVDIGGDDVGHQRLQVGDRRLGEDLADQLAQQFVFGGIHAGSTS